jgi:hemerythrin-like domain-containing protein
VQNRLVKEEKYAEDLCSGNIIIIAKIINNNIWIYLALQSTQDLKYDHITVRRLKSIIERCSEELYANESIPIEDIEVISVVIEEFVDSYHHGKEEQAFFPTTKDKDGFAEDIRKFLIEHELGRRIAIMLRRELGIWKQNKHNIINTKKEEEQEGQAKSNIDKKIILENEELKVKEPTARFLKSYAVFITDHTLKEDKFFDLIQQKNSLSAKEDDMLLKHYEACKNQMGGKDRIEQMIRLVEYLEDRWWMKDKR